MKLKVLLHALLKVRNVSVLLIALGLVYAVNTNMPIGDFTSVSPLYALIPYFIFAVQTLFDKKSIEMISHKEQISKIISLNKESQRLYKEARRYTNPRFLKKLTDIVNDKNQIVDSFFKNEPDFLKQKITEKTLDLVLSYEKMLINYCIRSRELSQNDIEVIVKRINENSRKLNFTEDPILKDNLSNLIEIDKKKIESLKMEKKDLDSVGMKLEYIEGTVDMFKHQIYSSVDSEELLERLDDVVIEASALDNVLHDRRKNKFRA